MSIEEDDVFKALNKRSMKVSGKPIARSAAQVPVYTHIGTGAFILDMALVGGIPENLVTCVAGKQHSGKTLLALKTVANYQKIQKLREKNGIEPKKVVWIVLPGEGLFPTQWAEKNGVDVENTIIVEPIDGDDAADAAALVMEHDSIGLVVFDSVAAIVKPGDLEKASEDMPAVAGVAGIYQKLLKKINSYQTDASKTGHKKTFLTINQWRTPVSTGGPPKARTMPGGDYARFVHSIEIDIKNVPTEGSGSMGIQTRIYNTHSFNIIKNKTANSIPSGEFVMSRDSITKFEPGRIMDHETVATYGKKLGEIGSSPKGWWMNNPMTGEEMKFDKKDDVVTYLIENENFFYMFKRKLIQVYRQGLGLPPQFDDMQEMLMKEYE